MKGPKGVVRKRPKQQDSQTILRIAQKIKIPESSSIEHFTPTSCSRGRIYTGPSWSTYRTEDILSERRTLILNPIWQPGVMFHELIT